MAKNVDLVWMVSGAIKEVVEYNIPYGLAIHIRKQKKNTTHTSGHLLLRDNKTQVLLVG